MRGLNIMQASRRWSKCLFCFAALLSPIQALQGTPIMWHSVSSCARANDACTGQGACCHHRSSKLTSSRGARGWSGGCGLAVTDHSRSSPRKCPPNCWCRHPALPQSKPVQPVRVTVSTDIVCVTLDVAGSSTETQLTPHTATPRMRPVDSAQQVCAVFCRFLT